MMGKNGYHHIFLILNIIIILHDVMVQANIFQFHHHIFIILNT